MDGRKKQVFRLRGLSTRPALPLLLRLAGRPIQQWHLWGFRRSLQRRNRPGFTPDSLFSRHRSAGHFLQPDHYMLGSGIKNCTRYRKRARAGQDFSCGKEGVFSPEGVIPSFINNQTVHGRRGGLSGRVGILPAERRILRRALAGGPGSSFGRDARTGGRDAHPTRERSLASKGLR
jgi:hypothetical protein